MNLAHPPWLAFGSMGIVALAAPVIFTHATRSAPNPRQRRWGTLALALIVGPTVGLGFAACGHAAGDIHPADVAATYTEFAAAGGVAGIFPALACAVAASVTPPSANKPDFARDRDRWA